MLGETTSNYTSILAILTCTLEVVGTNTHRQAGSETARARSSVTRRRNGDAHTSRLLTRVVVERRNAGTKPMPMTLPSWKKARIAKRLENRKRLQKYVVVAGKTKGKCGKIMSSHRKIKNAREYAKELKQRGYSGCIWQRTKREKAGARLSFAKKGQEYWLGKYTF